MSKKVLTPEPIVVAGDMSGDITSDVIKTQFMDSVAFQISFTGTPTGTFEVQSSLDYAVNEAGSVVNPGTWISVPVKDENGNDPAASGSADDLGINIFGIASPFLRLVYTATSGSGTLSALACAKEV